MGGIGTWYLVDRHPERFSAAIPVAAHPFGGLDVKVPFYVVHSRSDEIVAFSRTYDAVEELRARGGDVTLVAEEGLSHYRTQDYVDPLRGAVKWLKNIWAKGEGETGGKRRR
jgi:predicted peptidase